MTYYLGQAISEHKMTFEEYESSVNEVTKEKIVNFAAKINIDTIFFLKNEA